MLRAARPDDDRSHLRVTEHPGDRERCRLDVARNGCRLERLQRTEGLLGHQLLVGPRPQRHPRAGRIALAAPVFARQPAAAERAERGEAEALPLTHRQHAARLLLEQAELVLHPTEACEPEPVARLQRFLQLLRVEIARADRAHLPGLNELVERPQRLLDRRLRVGLVRQVQVEPLDSQPLQAAFQLPQDPLARETAIGGVSGHRPVDLRAEQNRLAALAAPLADPGLAAPTAVGGRGVEERDPCGPGSVHQGERLHLGLALPKELRRRADPAEVPAAEPDPGKLEAGSAQLPIVHAVSVLPSLLEVRR